MITELWDQLYPYLEKQFQTNEFLSGGVIVVMLTGALAYLRSVPGKIFNYIRYLTTSYLVVHNSDYHRYRIVLTWLSNNEHLMKRNRTLTISGKGVYDDSFGFGSSWMYIGWRFIRVTRSRDDSAQTGEIQTRETITIKMWGRNKGILQNIIDEAERRDAEARKQESTTVDLYMGRSGAWYSMGKVPKRKPESVILPEGVMDKLVNRIQSFCDNKQAYADLGIPHRLGFLFEGPPGTGKTSSILALASQFDADVRFINLSSMTDNSLISLCGDLNSDNGLQFLVLEDIDCTMQGDRSEGTDSEKDGYLTLSGVLNAIDGVVSGDRVLFMTTNHLDRLDHALIRPGRADVIQHMGNLDYEQALRMCQKFCPDDPTINQLAYDFVDKPACVAQEHLIQKFINNLPVDRSEALV